MQYAEKNSDSACCSKSGPREGDGQMNCLFKTRGDAPSSGANITLLGNLATEYATVTIDGVQYTTPQTVKAAYGAVMTLYVGGKSTAGKLKCKITVDGVDVISKKPGSYQMTITGNMTVSASYSTMYTNGAITVTTV